jgi:hypothetical protein
VSNIYKYYVAYTLTLEDWHPEETRKPVSKFPTSLMSQGVPAANARIRPRNT